MANHAGFDRLLLVEWAAIRAGQLFPGDRAHISGRFLSFARTTTIFWAAIALRAASFGGKRQQAIGRALIAATRRAVRIKAAIDK